MEVTTGIIEGCRTIRNITRIQRSDRYNSRRTVWYTEGYSQKWSGLDLHLRRSTEIAICLALLLSILKSFSTNQIRCDVPGFIKRHCMAYFYLPVLLIAVVMGGKVAYFGRTLQGLIIKQPFPRTCIKFVGF